jgi:hypothetical protein
MNYTILFNTFIYSFFNDRSYFLRRKGDGNYPESVGGIYVAHQAASTEHSAELAQVTGQPDRDTALDHSGWAG